MLITGLFILAVHTHTWQMAGKRENKSWCIHKIRGEAASNLLLLMFWEMLKLC